MQGLIGTWGAGKGKKDSEHRGGRWMPAGVDACKGGHAIQDLKRRGVIGCIKIGVSQYQGGGYGGYKDTEGNGKKSILQLSKVGRG